MAGEKDVRDRLAALPGRAVVAFAARCARRVQPLTHALPQQDRDAIARAIAVAEALANGDAGTAEAAAEAAAGDAEAAAEAAAGAAAWAAAWAARAAEAAAEAAAGAAAWAAGDAEAAAGDAARDAGDAEAAARAAASSDLDRLSALNLGRPNTLGAPIDPSEAGPLGPLWPDAVPDWYTKAPKLSDESNPPTAHRDD